MCVCVSAVSSPSMCVFVMFLLCFKVSLCFCVRVCVLLCNFTFICNFLHIIFGCLLA